MTSASFNIVEVFVSAAQKFPEACALKQDNKQITYQKLLQDVQSTAAGFLKKGIKDGDKVLVFVPMSLDLYRIVLALFYIGASPVFLDSWTSFKRLRECCEVVPCNALIASHKLLWIASFIRSLRNIPVKLAANFSHESHLPINVFPTAEQQTALVTFTTGSTGIPKAADRTHAYLAAQLKALTPLIPTDAQVIFSSLPIVVLINLALGKTTVLPPSRYKIKKPEAAIFVAKTIEQEKVEAIIVSPAVIEQLTAFVLPELRYVITGGGPVFPNLAAQISHQFPQVSTTVVFGSTEAEPISHLSGGLLEKTLQEALAEYGLPVGLPDKHAHVAIIPFSYEIAATHTTQEWADIILKPKQAGEIVVSGNHVLQHYLNNPEAEAFHKIKVSGTLWHRTGDAGRLGNDGILYFLGRCNEVISEEDRLLFPTIIAYQFCRLTGIPAAALLKIKDQLTLILEATTAHNKQKIGEALKACAIPNAKVIYLKKLPRDPRHQTKIDYEQLWKIIRRH